MGLKIHLKQGDQCELLAGADQILLTCTSIKSSLDIDAPKSVKINRKVGFSEMDDDKALARANSLSPEEQLKRRAK